MKQVSSATEKNPAAVSLGRLRQKNTTREERIALARKAGIASGKARRKRGA